MKIELNWLLKCCSVKRGQNVLFLIVHMNISYLPRQLNNVAQRYAQRLAASDNCLVHSGGKYGENLYYSTGQVKGNAPVKMWYNENELYNYNAPGFSMGTGES